MPNPRNISKHKIGVKGKCGGGEKRSKVIFVRMNVRVSTAEAKESMLVRLKLALKTGAKLGSDFIVGSNSISKLLEKGNASIICIARDGPPALHNHLVESARLRRVAIVVLPQLTTALAAVFSLKRATCFAIPKNTVLLDDNSNTSSSKLATSSVDVSMEEEKNNTVIIAPTNYITDEIATADAARIKESKAAAIIATRDAVLEHLLALAKGGSRAACD